MYPFGEELLWNITGMLEQSPNFQFLAEFNQALFEQAYRA